MFAGGCGYLDLLTYFTSQRVADSIGSNATPERRIKESPAGRDMADSTTQHLMRCSLVRLSPSLSDLVNLVLSDLVKCWFAMTLKPGTGTAGRGIPSGGGEERSRGAGFWWGESAIP